MKCKECIAYGKDNISNLCICGYSIFNFDGIKDFPDGSCGCRMTKKEVETRLYDATRIHPNRFTQFKREWGK